MDSTFWIGTALGALVSLVISIVANLYTPQIREFLDKRTQLRLSNKKTEELKDYQLAKGILAGHPLAVQQLDRRRDHGLRVMLYSVHFIVLAVGLISIHIAAASVGDAMLGHLAFIAVIVVNVASAAALMSSVFISGNVRDLIQKATNLEEYENDIRKKWGDDAI